MTILANGLSAIRAGQTTLHPTDLHLLPGERVGLVGASGSGKSTLGHVLTDRLRADGVAVAHVPQSPDEALDPLRTLAFHWDQAFRALGRAPDQAEQQRLFNAIGLSDADLNARPRGWSRGMQQRFVIAMALIGAPALLILDEPTSALDPLIAAATMDLLDRHLAVTDTGLLLITHDLGLAARRVDRLMVMDAGRIVEDARTQTLLDAPATAAAQRLVAHRSWAALPC